MSEQTSEVYIGQDICLYFNNDEVRINQDSKYITLNQTTIEELILLLQFRSTLIENKKRQVKKEQQK